MNDIVYLDPAYSTTRLVTRRIPSIENPPDAAFKSMLFLPPSPQRKGAGGLRTQGDFKRSLLDKPLVTVITVVFNGAVHIENTITSVISQSYDNVEYIIIDGGSTDGTLDIIAKYEDQIDYWVSEPDEGISDAFNKGIQASSGELIGMINADDWYDPQAVESVVTQLDTIESFSYGGCTYVTETGFERYAPPVKYYGCQIRKYMPHIHHPTVFVRRTVYEQYGLFRKQYKYAMDYDFFLNLYLKKCIGTPLFSNIAYMRTGGVSNRLYLDARREVYRISRSYGLPRPVALFYYGCFIFKYFVRKCLNAS